MSDPYKTLGIDRRASQDDVKSAYRKLAKKLHPDLNPGDAEVERRFKEVSQAYAILGDKEKREKFDRGEINASGQETQRGGFYRSYAEGAKGKRYSPFGFEANEDVGVDDIFSDLFGFGRGAGRRPGGRVHQKGADVTYRIKVDFVEAAKGARKRITLTDGQSLEVAVPPGTQDGQSLRLKGKGMAGLGGAATGDAFVEVTVTPHRFFTRQDQDIVLELPVSLQEAVLGASVQVPTIHGTVRLKIPAGSNSGSTLRLKGKGIAAKGGGKAGDQLVRLKVVLPSSPDPELVQLVREWADKHPYDPRKQSGIG